MNNVIKLKKTRPTKGSEGAGHLISMFYNHFLHNLKENGVSSDKIYDVLKDTRKEWLDFFVRFTNDETETVINDMEVFREDVFSNKETFKEYLKYD
ncbi:MAG: hypothetical protein CBC16_08905 [Verrucomicrobia bacterium TMED56]|nr:MAG: hypothetical protein CBC16_08905 [Verrucomicrobia bacterium TMED56]